MTERCKITDYNTEIKLKMEKYDKSFVFIFQLKMGLLAIVLALVLHAKLSVDASSKFKDVQLKYVISIFLFFLG